MRRELQLLFRLARGGDDVAMTPRLSDDELPGMLALAERHRVLAAVWEGVRANDPERVMPETPLPDHGDRFATSAPEALDVLRELDRAHDELLAGIATESGLPAGSTMLLKGRSLRRWYEPGAPRSCFDVDLSVPEPDHLWRLAEWLLGQGYELLGLGGAHVDPRDAQDWCPIFAFSRSHRDLPLELAVELHGPLMTKGLHGFIDLRPIADRAEAGADRFYQAPVAADCLLLLLVEVSERPLIVRDAVDFDVLLRATERAGLEPALRESIEAQGLRAQFVRLCRFWSLLSERKPPAAVAEWLGSWRGRTWWWRLASGDLALTRGISPLLEAEGLVAALRCVATNLSDQGTLGRVCSKLLRNRPTTIAGPPDPRRWFLILHLGPEPRGPTRIAQNARGHAMLRSPIGLFLATLAEHFDAAELVRERSAAPTEWDATPAAP